MTTYGNNRTENSTVIYQSKLIEATRDERFFFVELKKPHHVLTTSHVNGGLTQHITHLVNHQSMEPNNHKAQFNLILSSSHESYHAHIANILNVDSKKMVLMGTAANMNNVAHHQTQFKSLSVDAFVTAGVTGNAMRAGEETQWYQTKEGNKKVDYDGTINIMVLINQPLSPGALTKAGIIVTEAKSAALSELAVASRRSSHLATGTGTDQFTIAAPHLNKKSQEKGMSEEFIYESASGHLKLGELIGEAVREATLKSLNWQNRLAGKDTASVIYALERFGLTEERMFNHLHKKLSDQALELAIANKKSIYLNARLVASAYAYAAILDRFQYETLPQSIQLEVLKDNAANAAVALSGNTMNWSQAWQGLASTSAEPIDMFLDAIAIGWQAKW